VGRPEDVVAGQRLGPYELVRELGRGGFASVWLARRAGKGGFEVHVAIKVAKAELQDDPAFQKMFLDEARLQAQINHPNVVNVFELGEEGDLLYLVMEHVAGRPLNVLRNCVELAGGTIPVPIIMRILSDTCAGLHAAHELEKDGRPLGVIHRDVSPQNILVSDKGAVKLIDFGVAKANDRLAAETSAGHTKGKLRYMAPEQAVGKHLDRRADIWAVGAVAYDLVEGSPPFDGYNDLVRLFKLLEDQPPPAFTRDVPARLRAVIERCLQRDPARRFETAAELRTAIEQAFDDEGAKVTCDDVASFFRPWLSEDAETQVRASGRANLHERLKRTPTGGSTSTVDMPAPPQIETLGALDSSIRPTQRWRVPVAAVAAAVLMVAVAGVWRHRAGAAGEPAAVPPVVDAREEPRARDAALAEGASAPLVAAAPPPAALPSAVASVRPKAHPPRGQRTPSQPPPPATTTRRYDDTIQ
jgi:serine/threonine-protein kinase